MCWMVIGIAASIAGTVIGAMGQQQAAESQAQASEYQAQVDRNNAIVAQRMADDTRKRGAIAVEEQKTKTGALEGRQIAVMSANGIDVTSGSPLDILGDTVQLGEWDARTIQGNFERDALAQENQKQNFLSSASMNDFKASGARDAGGIAALGTLASGLGSVASQWYTKGASGLGKIG